MMFMPVIINSEQGYAMTLDTKTCSEYKRSN